MGDVDEGYDLGAFDRNSEVAKAHTINLRRLSHEELVESRPFASETLEEAETPGPATWLAQQGTEPLEAVHGRVDGLSATEGPQTSACAEDDLEEAWSPETPLHSAEAPQSSSEPEVWMSWRLALPDGEGGHRTAPWVKNGVSPGDGHMSGQIDDVRHGIAPRPQQGSNSADSVIDYDESPVHAPEDSEKQTPHELVLEHDLDLTDQEAMSTSSSSYAGSEPSVAPANMEPCGNESSPSTDEEPAPSPDEGSEPAVVSGNMEPRGSESSSSTNEEPASSPSIKPSVSVVASEVAVVLTVPGTERFSLSSSSSANSTEAGRMDNAEDISLGGSSSAANATIVAAITVTQPATSNNTRRK